VSKGIFAIFDNSTLISSVSIIRLRSDSSVIRCLAPAASIKSIALSGNFLSNMYCADKSTEASSASVVYFKLKMLRNDQKHLEQFSLHLQ
jgi:hypothetical protein